MTPGLRRLLSDTFIQPHFDYAGSAWYPNLNEKLKKKIQTTQKKCVQFCLNVDKMARIPQNEFAKLTHFSPVSHFYTP